MNDIFISYSHKDADYVNKLANALKKRGYKVWIDARIDYGSTWPQAIQDNLDNSIAFIIVMSPRSYQSAWVQNELSRAGYKNKRTFPLLLEGDTWLSLQATQCIDVRNGELPPKKFYDLLREYISQYRSTAAETDAEVEEPVSTEKKPGRFNLTGWLPRSKSVRWGVLAAILLFVITAIGISLLRHFPAQNTPSSGIPTTQETTNEGQSTVAPGTVEPAQIESLATELPTLTSMPVITPQTPFSLGAQIQTARNVVQVTLRDGSPVTAAADWLVFSNEDAQGELLTGITLMDKQSISFADMKSMDFGPKRTPDYAVTITLSNGKTITGALDYDYQNGSLKGLTTGLLFEAPFDDIQRMDFMPATDEKIEYNVATITNANGEVTLAPSDLLEATLRGSGYAGPYVWPRDGWMNRDGTMIPFKMMAGFEIRKDSTANPYTMVCTLLDGRTLTTTLDSMDNPYIRGITDLGAFHLDLENIKRVDFNRNNRHMTSLSSILATLTLQDGTAYKIPASLLAFFDEVWDKSFPISDYQNVFFNEIKSIKVQSDDKGSTVHATVELFSNQTFTSTSTIYGKGEFVGIDTSQNFVDVALKDLKQVDFEVSNESLQSGPMAFISLEDKSQIQLPLNSVRLLVHHNSMAGPWISYDDSISLTDGRTMQFDNVKMFDVGDYDSTAGHTPVTISLLDGQTLKSFFADNDPNSSLCGLISMGPACFEIYRIKSVNFNRKVSDSQQVLSTMASMTVQDGSVFQVPVKWLVYDEWDWESSFPVSASQRIPFDQMKSLKVEIVQNSPGYVSVTINLINGGLITKDRMQLIGNGNIYGLDVNGSFVSTRVTAITQIDFTSAALPALNIAKAVVVTKAGDQFQTPLNSVNVNIGGVSWAGVYSSSSTDGISLTSGIKVPLNKIKRFETGDYDSKATSYPITIYTTGGQVLNSFLDRSSASDFGVKGLTDNGPFSIDISDLKSVDFGR